MINKNNGQTINTVQESIQLSVEDIVTTPIGSRIMRRTYGSLMFELIDQPINDALVLKCYSAIYTAISTWESRINISQITLSSVKENGLVFDIEGVYQVSGQEMNLSIPLNMGAQA
ncbi:baseplate assembly protein [Acinetobacter sp. ANC 4204]|uniref:GPW/gp25 family protein n=1 Tax=Acinetobacter sp. ANC 4204 TaxID=1977884 RepID=UPI000A33364F|nr:GPW/gp25 family protein [Acinetobacter sp. ANC 4204]OTG61237.1 baseplate assembly protein [Acinetobacter sp. ANC 4204]